MANEPEEKKEEQKEPEEQAGQTPQTEGTGIGDGDKDEQGVSYKNRYAESERKRNQQAELMEEMTLRMNTLEQSVQPQPAPVAPAPSATQESAQSKNDMDEMIAMGPAAYNRKIAEQVQKESMQKQKNADAETLIRDKFGASRFKFGVSKVLDYAQQHMIDVVSDPKRAVAKILTEMDKPKVTLSVEDKKKTAEALRNKPESGQRPPAPQVNRTSGLMDKVRDRGDVDDVAAVLRETMFPDKK